MAVPTQAPSQSHYGFYCHATAEKEQWLGGAGPGSHLPREPTVLAGSPGCGDSRDSRSRKESAQECKEPGESASRASLTGKQRRHRRKMFRNGLILIRKTKTAAWLGLGWEISSVDLLTKPQRRTLYREQGNLLGSEKP